jgi:hypothetical protein
VEPRPHDLAAVHANRRLDVEAKLSLPYSRLSALPACRRASGETWMPTSSRSSRAAASAGVSPRPIMPAGTP